MPANSTEIVDSICITFDEETPGQLDGKENYLVELGTAANTVKILATAGNEVGTYVGRLTKGSGPVTVRLLGSPGTARYVAGGAIAKGGTFKAAAGGKVVAAATGRLLGRSLEQSNTADNQVFKALPLVENL